jgi:arylsulfatase A-like enzyme
VWCLINPHDVLGYPNSFVGGGYNADEFADVRVPLPETIDEDLRSKPTVQALQKIGQTSYLGALRTRSEQQRYVDFYAHLHRVVDRNIGRLLSALGDPGDPSSLRSRTVIVRTSDHGELGLSHGGLRQKMFNAYEEALRVPFVVSGPALFDGPASSDALVSLVDLVPTLVGLGGGDVDGSVDGFDLGPVLRGERDAVRDAVLFTYDDHQAGTAFQEAPGQPNRIRCMRDQRWKYAIYVDPHGRVAPEYELYDLESDPDEALNLVDKRSGAGRTALARRELPRLRARLEELCEGTGTALHA